jgi:hypothetical protein
MFSALGKEFDVLKAVADVKGSKVFALEIVDVGVPTNITNKNEEPYDPKDMVYMVTPAEPGSEDEHPLWVLPVAGDKFSIQALPGMIDFLVIRTDSPDRAAEIYGEVILKASSVFSAVIQNAGPPVRAAQDILSAVKGSDWYYDVVQSENQVLRLTASKEVAAIISAPKDQIAQTATPRGEKLEA